MTTTTTERERIHPWENAGLGKAPYRWLGVFEDRGPHRTTLPDGIILECGAPGQPMGTCAYCGQGIAECHQIRSADGIEFTVGCDCVEKVEHKGSPVYTEAERASRDLRNAKARKRASERAKAVRAELTALLGDNSVRARLAALPHPKAWAAEQGQTWLDQAEWLDARSGAQGRARLLKALKALLA